MNEIVGLRYELVERVGSGGTSEVWRATDRQTGGEVALKRLHAEVAADPVARARFRGEIAAADAVGHPYAVGVLDARDDDRDDGPRLVMEHVPGGSLAARFRTRDLEPLALGEEVGQVGVVHPGIYRHRELDDTTPELVVNPVDGRPAPAAVDEARRTVGVADDEAPDLTGREPEDPRRLVEGQAAGDHVVEEVGAVPTLCVGLGLSVLRFHAADGDKVARRLARTETLADNRICTPY